MAQSKGGTFIGLLLVLIGFLFLLNSLDLVDFGRSLGILWPLLLIGVGIWFMLRHRRRPGTTVNPEDHRSTMQLFGDVGYTANGRVPERLTVSILFGDAQIDLTRGEFPYPTHYIDHSSVFGDLKIRVPPSLAVSVSGHTLFGDTDVFGKKSGGFAQNLELAGGAAAGDARRLVISTNVVFGDVEVRTP